MKPAVHIIPVLKDNYCYLLEGADKQCIIIDPGQVKPVELYIQQNGLKPVLILNTHHHADHVAGNVELKSLYDISVSGPKAEENQIRGLTKSVTEGDVIEQSGLSLRVIETPGHTKGHIVFYCEDANALFSGDTVFSLGCGRLLECSPEEMFSSLQKLKTLPPQTDIYCGHEYTVSNGDFALTVDPDNQDLKTRMSEAKKLRTNNLPTLPVTLETELKTNPFLRASDASSFAALRSQKDNF